MFFLLAILIAFAGGVLGRGLKFRRTRDQCIAFLIPVALCTGLIHVPPVMDLLANGPGPVSWQAVKTVATFQALTLIGSVFLTGMGWTCSWFIQAMFEDPEN